VDVGLHGGYLGEKPATVIDMSEDGFRDHRTMKALGM
jgi:hypothetical protein